MWTVNHGHLPPPPLSKHHKDRMNDFLASLQWETFCGTEWVFVTTFRFTAAPCSMWHFTGQHALYRVRPSANQRIDLRPVWPIRGQDTDTSLRRGRRGPAWLGNIWPASVTSRESWGRVTLRDRVSWAIGGLITWPIQSKHSHDDNCQAMITTGDIKVPALAGGSKCVLTFLLFV